MITIQVISDLLKNAHARQQLLKKAYEQLPETQCIRKARCCTMLPEMTLVEALSIVHRLKEMPTTDRGQLMQNIIGYFFLNPVKITTCPFLRDRDCRIYADRAFGCRAYGLWSHAYYIKLAEQQRHAKHHLRKQWENLGVMLPKKICDFQTPYCLSVKIVEDAPINDDILLQISNKIETISKGLGRWHRTFVETYFCDLSFFLTASIFGTTEAVRMKFRLASAILSTGKKTTLNAIIKSLPDVFEGLNPN